MFGNRIEGRACRDTNRPSVLHIRLTGNVLASPITKRCLVGNLFVEL